MMRLAGTTDANNNNANVVTNVTYNAASQLLTMTAGFNETRTHNTLGQLTGLNNVAQNLTYNYPTGTNNGKIACARCSTTRRRARSSARISSTSCRPARRRLCTSRS